MIDQTSNTCCDVCGMHCDCVECKTTVDTQQCTQEPVTAPMPIYRPKLQEVILTSLHEEILLHRFSKVNCDSQCTIVAQISTIELLTNDKKQTNKNEKITNKMIDDIIKSHNCILSHSDVVQICPSIVRSDAVAVSDIIDRYHFSTFNNLNLVYYNNNAIVECFEYK